MKLLLDTHTFVWWDSDPSQLPSRVLDLCRDQTNSLLLSVASIWEMQLKSQLGKLRLNVPLAELVEHQQRINHVHVVTIDLDHVLGLENLEFHHKDPFDRLLIAQARILDADIVTRDSVFAQYPVKVLW